MNIQIILLVFISMIISHYLSSKIPESLSFPYGRAAVALLYIPIILFIIKKYNMGQFNLFYLVVLSILTSVVVDMVYCRYIAANMCQGLSLELELPAFIISGIVIKGIKLLY